MSPQGVWGPFLRATRCLLFSASLYFICNAVSKVLFCFPMAGHGGLISLPLSPGCCSAVVTVAVELGRPGDSRALAQDMLPVH